MQDLYIFIIDDKPLDFEPLSHDPQIITDRETAIGIFEEILDGDENPDINVIKSNPSDNYAYFVTMEIAEAAFNSWEDKYGDDPDNQPPVIYEKMKFERKERYDDNREHAADYRARAV